MDAPIPLPWCRTVANILRNGSRDAIITVNRADEDWRATFPDAWDYEWFDALAAALDMPGVRGKPVNMNRPGDTWSFWFYFRNRKLFAKINLDPGGKIIVIFSSHPPLKGDSHL